MYLQKINCEDGEVLNWLTIMSREMLFYASVSSVRNVVN
jgi:hypothetical protein